MRLNAFRCVYSVDESIRSNRNYQETSIRTSLSEDLKLRIEILGFFKSFKKQIQLNAFRRKHLLKPVFKIDNH
jgi:hypothetical protein